MITTENPLLIAGIPVLRDGDDPDLFWVLPSGPKLATTPLGDSSFTLFEYRTADGSGGGFAELEIELTTPGGAALAAQTGRDNARIAVAPFRSGDVRLLSVQDPNLVQGVLGATAAPLVPPFHTVFALDVSEQGAALLAQSATMPTAPIGVVYQLRFLAQTPALHAHVTMDYDRVYERFSASLGFTYYVSVRLDLELSWLVEHGFVKIEITQFSDDADQQRQQQAVMDLVRARIEGDFFTSALPQQSDAAPLSGALGQLIGNRTGGNITSTTALFVLKARYDVEKELKRFEIFYDGRTVEELTHVVSGYLGRLAGEAGTPPVVRQITADDPFFAALDVAVIVGVDFDDVPDLREAAVTITYGQHVQTYVATAHTPGPFRFTCPLDPTQPQYTTHTEFHFDPSSAAGPATISPPDTTRRDRAFVTGSADAFRVYRVRVSGATTAFDLVANLPVVLRILPTDGGPVIAQDELVLDKDHQQFDWYRRVPGTSTQPRVVARADWVDTNGVRHEGDEVEVFGANFLARGPVTAQSTVLVQPAVDWTQIGQVAVEIRQQVLGTVQTQSLLFSTAAGTEPKSVRLSLSDPDQRTYSWKASLLRTDGTSSVGEWRDSDDAVLLITDDAKGRASVRVVWLGDVASALAMRVDFWVTPEGGVEQQVASALLQPAQTDVTISWPSTAATAPSYRYEVHRLDALGDALVKSGTDTTGLLVVRTNG